jgi:hypothetical protein
LHHQRLAYLRFERTQPLRHRRLRDRQPLRGTLEVAVVSQRGQAGQGGRVQVFHQIP